MYTCARVQDLTPSSEYDVTFYESAFGRVRPMKREARGTGAERFFLAGDVNFESGLEERISEHLCASVTCAAGRGSMRSAVASLHPRGVPALVEPLCSVAFFFLNPSL